MKTYFSMRRLFIPCIFMVLYGLSSCNPLDNQSVPDRRLCVSFQIANTSPNTVTLHFYHNDQPSDVYVEYYLHTDPVFVTQNNAVKNVNDLTTGNSISLQQGKSVLFYKPYSDYQADYPPATCLQYFGSGSSFVRPDLATFSVVGDKLVISSEGKPDSTINLVDPNVWKTWYNEKEYIYYRILVFE